MRPTLRAFSATLILFTLLFQAAPVVRAASLLVTTVTVSSHSVGNWRYGGTTAKLRIYASETFEQSGNFVIGSNRGSGQWYQQVDCTVAGTIVTVPSFSLYVTTTASNPYVNYTLVWVDAKGVERDVYLSEIRVPESFGATVTLAQLHTFSTTRTTRRADLEVYNKDQVNALLSTNPIGVGDNDRRMRSNLFNVKAYGALCDWTGAGTGTDDTVAINSALTAALAANGALYFPGFCKVSGTGSQILLVNKSIEIFGDSRATAGLVVASSTGSSTDVIHIVPPATGSTGPNVGSYAGRDNRGYYLHDFTIMNDTGTSPAGNGGGRNALRVTTTAAGSSWHDSVIERVDMLRLGNQISMVWDNEASGSPANTDGIWAITVSECLIFDGFLGQFIGDNIAFENNQFREFTSNNPALDIYQVHDAVGLSIRHNHIYNKFGVRIQGAQKPVIDHNIIEAPDSGPVQGTDGAILNLKGNKARIEAASITNNRIHGRAGEPALNAVVRVDNASDTFFGNNYFVAPTGQPAIVTTANAVRTRTQTVVIDASHDNGGGPFGSPMLGTDNQYNAVNYRAPISAAAIPGSAPGYSQVEEVRPLRINLSDTTVPAWNSGFRPMMLGANSSAVGDIGLGGATSLQLTQNAYLDSGGVWKYISTGPASNISFTDGAISFRTAPSGAAGATVTWQTAYRVNSAGFANETVGANVASAASIAPSANFFTITGTITISTISAISTTPGTVLHMITTSGLTFDETGNIDVSGGTSLTTTANQLVIAAWDGTKWRLR